TYSITNLKTEYQIGAILEGGSILGYNVLPQTYAATPLKKATAMVVGTYNEKILKTSTGGLDYILAVPSIINGDIQDVDLMSIITKKQLVYNNYTNLPDSYKNLGYSMTGGFDFIPNKLVVYSGSTQDLLQDSNKLIFIGNLKQAYSGTIIQNNPTYKEIINTDTTINQVGAITLVNDYLISGVGGLPKITQEQIGNTTQPNSCEAQPSYTNATFTEGTPTLINQAWQNTNNANPCYYTCINGYTGSDCSTPPPSFLQNCTANGQIIYEDANGLELGRVNNAGTVLSGTPGLLTCAGHIAVCSGNGIGYIIQPCNLGTNVIGTSGSSFGNYYQWGRNKGFPYGDTSHQATQINGTIGLNAATDTYGFVWDGALPGQAWPTTAIDNNWGGSTTSTTLTYWDVSEANKILMQGPCSNGYHVPTQKELNQVVIAWGGGSNGINLSNSLKLPIAGNRLASDGSMEGPFILGRYWMSSRSGGWGFFLNFTSSAVEPSNTSSSARGNTIRCFKN
nr:hypothetical protein [Candidatus Gracilibacteria bacterium]